MKSMTGYTLITGAASDIGRQICISLEAAGHVLIMTDLEEGALLETRSSLRFPDKHLILPLDLSEVESAEATLADFLVNNQLAVSNVVFAAGIFAVKPIKMANYAFVKKSFDVALFSIFAITRILTSKKTNADNLCGVVMISSVSAVLGTKGYAVYGAAKAAMLGLMKSMAVELAPQARVNAVMPGGIRTRTTNYIFDMQENPNMRYLLGEGEKMDVANMVEFLLSDKARWVTGQGFVVDGGLISN